MFKKILLVDDEKNVRELVRATLESEEYTLIEARDGLEAIEAVRRHDPDLVVMDWMMPGMSGVEATAALRRAAPGTRPAILLLTARGRGEDRAAGLAAGAAAYLVKPFSPFELLDKVEQLLESSIRAGSGHRSESPP